MPTPKNFPAGFLQKPTSSRGIGDAPEPQIEETPLPSPQLMIDALYEVLMERLDRIEHTQKTIIELCHEMKSHS